MVKQLLGRETLILSLVNREECLQLEQIVAMLPELSWNQVFQTVDALSRRGKIRLRRRGYEYELAPIRHTGQCLSSPI
ncbi:MAG: hypothetical protein ACT4OO_12045 [Nitrospiraceae bacterium]